MDCCPSDPNPLSKSPTIPRCSSTTPIWPNLPRRTTKYIEDRTGPPHDPTRGARHAAGHARRKDPHRAAGVSRDDVDDGYLADRAVLRDRGPLHHQGAEST